MYFPQTYDIKYLMKSCKSLKGGLQDVADDLKVERIGPQHQAGSDSLLTCITFFKMRKVRCWLLFPVLPSSMRSTETLGFSFSSVAYPSRTQRPILHFVFVLCSPSASLPVCPSLFHVHTKADPFILSLPFPRAHEGRSLHNPQRLWPSFVSVPPSSTRHATADALAIRMQSRATPSLCHFHMHVPTSLCERPALVSSLLCRYTASAAMYVHCISQYI